MLVVLLGILSLTGCAIKGAARANILLESSPVCPLKVVLVDCQLTTDPPQCKKSRTTYRKGCEKIQIQGGSKQ